MRRIVGLDVARAVAIAGMVVVNFKVVMFAEQRGPEWLQTLTGLLDGRAAAAFVVLAGIGASLMTARNRREGDLVALAADRRRLLRRAVFLLVVGYLFVLIWPADILHYYAFYLGIGAFLLAASDRALVGWAVLAAALFVALYSFAGYWDQLDVVDLTYEGFWTPVGLTRNLLFNGWHPVMPWVAFYLIGMWLGRRDLRDPAVRRCLLLGGVAAAAVGETIGALNPVAFDVVTTGPSSLGVAAGIEALWASDPLPPGPIYLLAAGGTAVVLIVLCVGLGLRWPESRAVRWAALTGQLALTIYFAHVLVGMGTLEATGRLNSQTLVFALGSAGVFMVAAVVFSVLWRCRFRRGPIEALMRRLSA